MAEALPSRGRLVVGLISGTSMDGVDAGLVRLTGAPSRPRVQLLAFLTTPYPRTIQRRLLEVASGEPASAGEISRLNFWLGRAFAEAALRVCRKGGISPERLAAIGSHGQTIYHQGRPSRVGGRPVSSTLQIAEPAVIAEMTGVRVVADFRAADIAAGGQGAPLVPLVDYLLLRHPARGTVALNLGGIANVTVIPANSRPEEVFGFDTGPGNMVMDALARRLLGKPRDEDGRQASRGGVIEGLLARLLRSAYFRQVPPKSAGREHFGRKFIARYFLSSARGRDATTRDLLCTACELTARTVAGALQAFVFPRVRVHRLIVSGGGSHHRLLMTRLTELLPQVSVELSDDYGLPADAKEAIAFALLADRTLAGLPGNLPSVTGARRAVVLGNVVWPGGSSYRRRPRYHKVVTTASRSEYRMRR